MGLLQVSLSLSVSFFFGWVFGGFEDDPWILELSVATAFERFFYGYTMGAEKI